MSMTGLQRRNRLAKDDYTLLSVEEMARADQMTIRSGIAGAELMNAAGLAVARHIMHRYSRQKTLILCGPGNNGGDGFVIARLLQEAGWDVSLTLLGSVSGDAALMADRWDGAILPFADDIADGYRLVVDALFGTGLSRPVGGAVAGLFDRLNSSDINVVAVDIPSGIMGNSGQITGAALRAESTVTFFRRQPGHLLYPGKEYCGDVEVTDIGIPARVIGEIRPETWRNDPALWREYFPCKKADSHKYDYGHAVVISGGPAHGGAARLAARAALRVGGGLVSVACPDEAVLPHAAQLTAVMIKMFSGKDDIGQLLADRRLNGWCIGPGAGVTAQTRSHVRQILAAGRHCVMDADALTVFSDDPQKLFNAIGKSGQVPLLTPHGGEFSRLFPDLGQGSPDYDKLASTRKAAQRAGAVIIHKGPDTVIAGPDGRAVINDNAPATLATAGSGDVLAGLCLGLLVQGMAPFEAACAAVWIHGAAAEAFGPGLVSEDIEGRIPDILRYISELSG